MNQNITVIQGYSDPLLDRYNELAFMQNIADMQAYAEDWHVLGDDAIMQDRPALAETVYARALHYAQMVGGEYIRVIEQPFAELRQVTEDVR